MSSNELLPLVLCRVWASAEVLPSNDTQQLFHFHMNVYVTEIHNSGWNTLSGIRFNALL